MKAILTLLVFVSSTNLSAADSVKSFKIEGKMAEFLLKAMTEKNFKWYGGDHGMGRLGKVNCGAYGNVDDNTKDSKTFICEFVSE